MELGKIKTTEYPFSVIETDDASQLGFAQGQFIIQDNGKVFYDPTNKDNLSNRIELTKEYKLPEIIQPSIDINLEIFNVRPMQESVINNTYEVGTSLDLFVNYTCNLGSYEYGPDTGVELYIKEINLGPVMEYNNGFIGSGSWLILHNKTINSESDMSGSIPQGNVNLGENPMYVEATFDIINNGSSPNMLPTGTYDEGKIQSIHNIHKQYNEIKSYIQGLYYGTMNEIVTIDDLNSDGFGKKIRDLNKSNCAYEEIHNKTFIVPKGAKTIILATPVNKIGIIKIMNNTAGVDMISNFTIEKYIVVPGLYNGYVDIEKVPQYYNVWIYSPAEPYEYPAEITVTLG